ncbi:MAG: serine/threonine protein kinase [Pirellulales bacterium]
MNRVSSPFDHAELLWQFDRDLAGGFDPDWETLIGQCPDDASRAQLCADMIRIDASQRGWDPESLRNRLQWYARQDPSDTGLAGVIRGIYADRLAAGEHPDWSEFAAIGHDFDRMRLGTDEEPVHLGQVLAGRFRIEQQLGVGGFGIVYRGTDLTQLQKVAIKTIRVLGEDHEPIARALLKQEADVLTRLRTTGVPQLIELLEDSDGRPVLVREFVDGQTLLDLRRSGALAPERAATIVARLATTLQFAHRRGLLHRDLSATNVLVDQHDVPYLTDFGLGVAQAALFDQARHTAGTQAYMSVESQIGATREIDARDDVWSLGILLCELLTGRSPLPNNNLANALQAASEFQKVLIDAGSMIPPALRMICERCAADDADDRYDTAGLVSRELRRFLGEALPPVDEARVELAQRRLWAWRAGMSFGNAYRCQAHAHWRLARLVTESDFREAAAPWQLIFASLKTLLDEFLKCTKFAGKLGVPLAKVDGIPEFVSAYNNCRSQPSRDLCDWLSSFIEQAGGTIAESYAKLESQLHGDGSATTALLKLALAAGSQALGEGVPRGLAELTAAAGLPDHATARYITCVSGDPNSDDHEREVDRVRKSVERELMNQLADALGDPQ